MEWSGSSHTMSEALARMKQREEASVKCERAMAYAFSHQDFVLANASKSSDFYCGASTDKGEGRVKMPLSPVASAQNRTFAPDIQLASSSLSSVAHSFSSSSLGQSQFDSTSNMSGFYSGPHRGQMRLQSRRSQSREDLNCSVADAHLVKV